MLEIGKHGQARPGWGVVVLGDQACLEGTRDQASPCPHCVLVAIPPPPPNSLMPTRTGFRGRKGGI